VTDTPPGGPDPPEPRSFEFSYVTTETGLPTQFGLGGIAEDVAHGIWVGLQGVDTIGSVLVVEVTQIRSEVPVPP